VALKRAVRFYFTEDIVFVKSAFYKTYGQGNCLGLGGGRGSYSRESVSFEQLWPEEFGALIYCLKMKLTSQRSDVESPIFSARREASKVKQAAREGALCRTPAQGLDTSHGSGLT